MNNLEKINLELYNKFPAKDTQIFWLDNKKSHRYDYCGPPKSTIVFISDTSLKICGPDIYVSYFGVVMLLMHTLFATTQICYALLKVFK